MLKKPGVKIKSFKPTRKIIGVKFDTYARLCKGAKFGDSADTIINRLLDKISTPHKKRG